MTTSAEMALLAQQPVPTQRALRRPGLLPAALPRSPRAAQFELPGLTELDAVTISEAVEQIHELMRTGGRHLVATANVDHIVKLSRSAEFRAAYSRASLRVADGMPLVWLSKVCKQPLPARVTGVDLVERLLTGLVGGTVYLLGAAPEINARAVEILHERHPGFHVTGYAPPVGFESDPVELEKALAHLRDADPSLVIVCLGAPRQEIFVARHWNRLPKAVFVGAGGTLDFFTGNTRRAPAWMQRAGLEWVHRLLSEPGRLWRRYLVDDSRFLLIALAQVWQHLFARRPRRALNVVHVGPDPQSLGGMATVVRHLAFGGAQHQVSWHPDDRLFSVTRFARSILRLLRLRLHRVTSQLVHVHLSVRGSFVREGGLLLLARALGIARVATIHGGDILAFGEAHPRLVGAVLRSCDAITVLDKQVLDLCRQLAPSVPVRLVPNPVQAWDGPPVTATAPVVLFLGDVSRLKGVDVLLEAWAQVKAAMPEARLLLAGRLVDVTPEPDASIEVLGPLPHDDVLSLLGQARLVVLPSRVEALPMALLEAMAAARPVVATPVGGVPQLVREGCGTLVPVGDAGSLANAIQAYLADPVVAAADGASGRQLVMTEYGMDTCHQTLNEIYAVAVKRRKPR